MSRAFALIALIALAAGLVPGVQPGPAAARPAQAYIVLLNEAKVSATGVGVSAAALARDHRLDVTNVYETVVRGFAARMSDDALAELRRDPLVARVEPDLPVWATTERLPTGVDRIGADRSGEGKLPTKAGVPVAILDTGIAPHPELNIAGGFNCTSKDRTDWKDKNGHGTHVAGIIGARNNGRGVVGVAPGTPLYAVKVLDNNGTGRFSHVLCGLEWTARRGITVANLSLAGRPPDGMSDACSSSILHLGVCNATAAGVRIVAAAGNDGLSASRFAPALYSQVITVAALADSDGCAGGHGPSTSAGPDDTLATFSNYGPAIDVAAPGVAIRSTWKNGRYKTLDGTSMAAPHVAGAIALGWDGLREPGPAGDPDGIAEGILSLSGNTACWRSGVPNP